MGENETDEDREFKFIDLITIKNKYKTNIKKIFIVVVLLGIWFIVLVYIYIYTILSQMSKN
jgi:hypothetical protein